MLTVKAPIQIKSGRDIRTMPDLLSQRILSDYRIMQMRITPEEFLHLATTPPEYYEERVNHTQINLRRVENYSKIHFSILNTLLNRASWYGSIHFSYSDQIFVWHMLRKVGISRPGIFLHQLCEVQKLFEDREKNVRMYHQNQEILAEVFRRMQTIESAVRQMEGIQETKIYEKENRKRESEKKGSREKARAGVVREERENGEDRKRESEEKGSREKARAGVVREERENREDSKREREEKGSREKIGAGVVREERENGEDRKRESEEKGSREKIGAGVVREEKEIREREQKAEKADGQMEGSAVDLDQKSGRGSRYYLQDQIYRNLQTVRLTKLVAQFADRQESIPRICKEDFLLGQQMRRAELICLQEAELTLPWNFQRNGWNETIENPYEYAGKLPEKTMRESLEKEAAAAIVWQLLQQFVQFQKQEINTDRYELKGANLWIDVSPDTYQSMTNVLERFWEFHKNAQSRETLIVRAYIGRKQILLLKQMTEKAVYDQKISEWKTENLQYLSRQISQLDAAFDKEENLLLQSERDMIEKLQRQWRRAQEENLTAESINKWEGKSEEEGERRREERKSEQRISKQEVKSEEEGERRREERKSEQRISKQEVKLEEEGERRREERKFEQRINEQEVRSKEEERRREERKFEQRINHQEGKLMEEGGGRQGKSIKKQEGEPAKEDTKRQEERIWEKTIHDQEGGIFEGKEQDQEKEEETAHKLESDRLLEYLDAYNQRNLQQQRQWEIKQTESKKEGRFTPDAVRIRRQALKNLLPKEQEIRTDKFYKENENIESKENQTLLEAAAEMPKEEKPQNVTVKQAERIFRELEQIQKEGEYLPFLEEENINESIQPIKKEFEQKFESVSKPFLQEEQKVKDGKRLSWKPDQRLELIYKSRQTAEKRLQKESDWQKKEIQKLLQVEQAAEKKKTADHTKIDSAVIEKLRSQQRQLLNQETQRLQKMVEQNLYGQVNMIADKVYSRLERRLKNEQKRRGW